MPLFFCGAEPTVAPLPPGKGDVLNAKQSLLNQFKSGAFALLTDEEISKKLRLGKRESLAVRDILRALCREGELLCDARYRYGTAEQFGAVTGKISGNERGFGFFVPDDSDLPDLFIPRRALKNALHGDSVLAFCTGGRAGDEGEVLAVISRGYREIVGIYRRDRMAGYVTPDERKFDEEVYIPANKHNGAKNGDKVAAKINSYAGRTPTGEVIEIIGRAGDFLTEENALIRAHALRTEFPEAVLAEAERQAARPVTELTGRVDLRDELIITVDGEDTRDIDDAISVRKEGDKFYLGVHIADVTHYVTRGSELDREAFARGTSVYFPDRVLPMLPPALSNGICSLNEGEDRFALSCLMTVNRGGEVTEKRVVPAVIRSRHRMTYADVTAIIRKEKETAEQYPDLTDFLTDAAELTEILKEARQRRGAVDLAVKEAKILYENGTISVPDYERTVSHEMIEQFMVLANESVAELAMQKQLPFVYRIHEAPAPEKASAFAAFCNETGVPCKFDPENVAPKDFQAVLNGLKDSPLFHVVNRVMLRSMMKAIYSPENKGHFGLASSCYCHFTSPIRRYPDLCIHRIIKESFLSAEQTKERYKNFVKDASAQSSECERNAQEAERDVDALYLTAFMQDKIGMEFEATISGVTSFGLFAELDNTVEGLIPVETLPDDSYYFAEEKFLLRGTRNSFRLGERVRVRVDGVDRGARRTVFALLEKI